MSIEEKKEILRMVEEGKITAEEAITLLNALEADLADAEESAFITEASAESTREPAVDHNLNAIADKVRSFWRIPLGIGIVITVLGGIWMLSAMQSAGFGFWFYCAWIPFVLGVFVIALSAGSRSSRWLFVHIKQAPGERPENITFGFPIPLRLVAWFLRNFGEKIPGLDNLAGVDEILEMLANTPAGDAALIVDVHDEGGEEVQIFVG